MVATSTTIPLTHIQAAVDELRPELVAFLQRLVRSASLPNHEGEVQQIIANKLHDLGLAVTIVPTLFAALAHHPAFADDGFSPDARINVVGRWHPAAGTAPVTGDPQYPLQHELEGPTFPDSRSIRESQAQSHRAIGQGSLILQGHVDVVSPGERSGWEVDPWSGELRDGCIYGRGACDMKAGVTAGIFALAALRRLGYRPAHEVQLQTVTGEESGGTGALATIVAGYRADAAIILEPTLQAVCPIQAGALTFRLTVQGKASHAAMKSQGVSAIEKYLPIHQAIEALDRERHTAYHNPLYPDPKNVAPISIGVVRGGEWHSTVAETVVAEGRCGVFPGESVAHARAQLEAAVAGAAQADPWLRDHLPLVEWFEGQFEAAETPVAQPLIQTLLACHTAQHGAAPAILGVPYGADMRLYTDHAHIPSVLYGPGDVSLAHAANEYVPVARSSASPRRLHGRYTAGVADIWTRLVDDQIAHCAG